MPTAFALTDATTWIGGFDFTGHTNQITVSMEMEDLDATVFGGNGYRARAGGLKDVSGEHSGFWSAPVDEAAFTELGMTNIPVTVSPTGVEGSPAYMYQATKLSYEQFGGVGELTPFSLSITGSDTVGVVRGKVAAVPGEVSATGALGSAVQLSAPLAGQYVYATLHVFTAGTSLTVQVQSDDNAGMSSPTTRATFSTVTDEGGVWLVRVPGPFTGEQYFRFNVSAITGTFEVAGAIAVQ